MTTPDDALLSEEQIEAIRKGLIYALEVLAKRASADSSPAIAEANALCDTALTYRQSLRQRDTRPGLLEAAEIADSMLRHPSTIYTAHDIANAIRTAGDRAGMPPPDDQAELLRFFNKHGLPSMVAESCLTCGHTLTDVAYIRHAELPNVVVCQSCVESIRAAAAKLPETREGDSSSIRESVRQLNERVAKDKDMLLAVASKGTK